MTLASQTTPGPRNQDYGRNHPAPVRTIARYTALHQDQGQLAAEMLEMAQSERNNKKLPPDKKAGNTENVAAGKAMRASITDFLTANGPSRAASIARGIGRYPTTVKKHLDRMVASGRLQTEDTRKRRYWVVE